MKYPPFPAEHVNSPGINYLDINKNYIIEPFYYNNSIFRSINKECIITRFQGSMDNLIILKKNVNI